MATLAFEAQRAKRVSILKGKLFETLLKEDGGVYLAKTGSLLRGSSLRSLENRRVFASILDAFPVDHNGEGSSRIWTKRLFKDTIAALVSEHQLELPMIPGFKFDRWLEDQADLLQGLAKKARRNSGGAKSGSTSSLGSAMDAEQTLPYNAEDGEHTYKDIQRIYIYIFIYICVYLIQFKFDIYFCRILFLKVHVHVLQLHQFGARGF